MGHLSGPEQACPLCKAIVVLYTEQKWEVCVERDEDPPESGIDLRVYRCPNQACRGYVIEKVYWYDDPNVGEVLINKTERLYPAKEDPAAPPPEVPAEVREDYDGARRIAKVNADASAALARRCLHACLSLAGFKGKQLSDLIDDAQKDPRTTSDLLESFHIVRNVGNYAVHPIRDREGELLKVEPGELEALFLALDDTIDLLFVRAKRRALLIEKLDEKLKSAGKPTITELVRQRKRADGSA